MLRTDHVPIDAHLKESIQFGGAQDGVAVLAGGDDSYLEPVALELMNQLDTSIVGQNSRVLYDLVYKVILAVPEPADSACGESSGVPSGIWMLCDLRKSRTPSKRGFPST
jgi:hypothetical protein